MWHNRFFVFTLHICEDSGKPSDKSIEMKIEGSAPVKRLMNNAVNLATREWEQDTKEDGVSSRLWINVDSDDTEAWEIVTPARMTRLAFVQRLTKDGEVPRIMIEFRKVDGVISVIFVILSIVQLVRWLLEKT